MTSPAQEPDPVALILEQGKVWFHEAQLARMFRMPSRLDAPQEFAQAVIKARAGLDRLEELLGVAQALAGEYRRKAAELEQKAADDWDAVLNSIPPGHRLRSEYVGARELASHANLHTLDQRRQARQWAKAADLARDLAERIRLMHRGLDGTRLDIHRVLGYFPVERSMERGS